MNEKYTYILCLIQQGRLWTEFSFLKSHFANFEYEKKEYAFVRTEQQIDKIIKNCSDTQNPIILYNCETK